MRTSHPSQAAILQQVGLAEVNDYNVREFTGYVSAAYRNSATEDRDAVHRMYERILLHHASGLRMAYLTEESYFDDTTEYLLIDCFVITRDQQKVSVQAIDLQKQLFTSAIGPLPFEDIRPTLEEGD
jgi:hypothetical protein